MSSGSKDTTKDIRSDLEYSREEKTSVENKTNILAHFIQLLQNRKPPERL